MDDPSPDWVEPRSGSLASLHASPSRWGDHAEERDYSCIAASRFAPLLEAALQRSRAITLGPIGTALGLLPDPHDGQPLAGLELLAERSGVDKKVIKRILQGRVATVELRTADALLIAMGMHLDHALVIPAGRRAARRMAEEEAAARRMPYPATFIRWRTEQLYCRRLAHLKESRAAFLSTRLRRTA